MVPEGWLNLKLGKVAEFQRGFDLPKSKRVDGVTPIISSAGLSGFHNEAKVAPPGVVTGRYGSIGQVFFIEEDFWPLNTSLWVKDFHGNDPKFIYYLLSKFDFKKFSDKTGVPGVNRNDLHAIKVFVPPFAEQKKIAQILATWDKAITTTEQLLANSQQQKKALMQQLLTGKKRLLDENGKPFSGEWNESDLDKLFNFKKGQGISKAMLTDNGRKCVLYGELYTRYGEVIDEVISRTNSNQGIESQDGDILIPASTTTTGIDLANATALLMNDVSLGGDINILRPKVPLDSPFFAYLITHVKKFELARRAQGITIIHLYGKDLKSISVQIPKDLEEQKAISDFIESIQVKVNLLEDKIVALKLEKKALMQQLLTGKRRVKVDQEVA